MIHNIQEEIRKQREEEARKHKEQEKILAERKIIKKKEKSLNEAEKEAVNELLSTGTTKLANSFFSSAVDQQGSK